MGKVKPNTIKIVKKANSALVLDSIKTYGSITVDSILRNTGLSRPTILKVLKDLLEKRIIIKAGFGESEIGRSPILYSLNTNEIFAIGVDVDGPPIHIGIADISGRLLHAITIELEEDSSILTIKNAISQGISECIDLLKIKKEDVLGVGLGLPASIDIKNNCALNVSRFSALAKQPIADMLFNDNGIPVTVRNDAHLIGVAEKRKLSKDISDMLCIIHRTGIGMATILNNQLYSGDTGNSGFIGHMVIDCQGKECACGRKGCLEALASKRAIRELYHNFTGEKKKYSEIIESAQKNDEVAIETCRIAGNYLGIGIANVVKTLDIYTIVISDIGCNEDHIFFKSIYKSLKEYVTPYFNKPFKLYSGKLRSHELPLGGCIFIIDNFFVSPELKLRI